MSSNSTPYYFVPGLSRHPAMAAAGLIALAAPAAMAEDVPVGKMQLKLGGYVEFQAAFFNSKLNNETGREFIQKSQITVDGELKADNGLLRRAAARNRAAEPWESIEEILVE